MSVNGTPEVEKSTTERLIEKKKQELETLKARQKAENRQRVQQERKKRTRQLIKIGAIVANTFQFDPLKINLDDFNNLMSDLKSLEINRDVAIKYHFLQKSQGIFDSYVKFKEKPE